MEWDAFADYFAREHEPGEHVSIVGPTGSGKSILGLQLCQLLAAVPGTDGKPSRVVIFGNKPRDRTLTALKWPVLKEWPPGYGQDHVIVWPRPRDPQDRARKQARVFSKVLRAIYTEGDQTVYIDEAAYFERPLPNGLGLSPLIEEYWQSARANDLTLIAATQRPRRVTISMWTEASWIFVFRLELEDDLKRVAEMGGNREQFFEIHDRLGGHEFVCVRRPRGAEREFIISKVGGRLK